MARRRDEGTMRQGRQALGPERITLSSCHMPLTHTSAWLFYSLPWSVLFARALHLRACVQTWGRRSTGWRILRHRHVQAEANPEAEEARKEADEARRDAHQARREAEQLRTEMQELRTEMQELRAAQGQAGALVREEVPARQSQQARQAWAHCHSSVTHCHSSSSLESACSSSTSHAPSSATTSPAKSVEQSPTPTCPQVVSTPLGRTPKGCKGLSSEPLLDRLVGACAAAEDAAGAAATPSCGTLPPAAACSLSAPHSILAPDPAPARNAGGLSSPSPSSSSSGLIGWMCMCVTCGIMALVCVRPSHMCACFSSAVQAAVDLWTLAASGSHLAPASSCQGGAQARQVGLEETDKRVVDSAVTPDYSHGGGSWGTW